MTMLFLRCSLGTVDLKRRAGCPSGWKVGGSGKAGSGLKSCNLAIPVSGVRLRTAYDGNGREAVICDNSASHCGEREGDGPRIIRFSYLRLRTRLVLDRRVPLPPCGWSPFSFSGSEGYQSAPDLAISSSRACLEGLRSVPALRGRWGMSASLRRAARRAASSAISVTASWGSVDNVFDAIIAHAFLADAAFKIGQIRVRVKG